MIVNGSDTRQTKISQLARTAGMVFQNPAQQLFANSVWHETIFALKNFAMLDEQSKTYAEKLVQDAGLSKRMDDHPFRLSYGQMRRLNLISIISYRPKLYLLDEILIGQDPGNVVLLLQQLQEQTRQGAAVLMVNHHPEAALWFATRIIFIQDGRILVDLPTLEAFEQLKRLGLSQYIPAGEAQPGALA